MTNGIDQVRQMFRERGGSQYGGEAVTQLEHALQAAQLAQAAGADAPLIAAALLHDVGHLLHDLPDDALDQGVDDAHEARAARWLAGWLPAETVEPVRLHVAAKRYLCATDPVYHSRLSGPSIQSLRLQGGPMTDAEAATFRASPFFQAAVRLRVWDEAAKVPGLQTPDVDHFLAFVEQAANRCATDFVNDAPAASRVRAVITDWAGTIVDYGSLAPTTVLKEVYRLEGVAITDDEARQPMGRAKRDHLAAVAAMPRVAGLWASVHGRAPGDADVDRMYAAFLPLQKRVLGRMSRVIPGVAQTIARLREAGLKIGSTTGYTRELMSIVTSVARDQGLDIDTVLTADDVPAGRPAPWMVFQAAQRLGVYPMWNLVTVDDTPVGIEAGRNAGAWAVGVARTGNGLGLPEEAALALSPEQWESRRLEIEAIFQRAGANFVIDSFEELEGVIGQIDRRLALGQRP